MHADTLFHSHSHAVSNTARRNLTPPPHHTHVLCRILYIKVEHLGRSSPLTVSSPAFKTSCMTSHMTSVLFSHCSHTSLHDSCMTSLLSPQCFNPSMHDPVHDLSPTPHCYNPSLHDPVKGLSPLPSLLLSHPA